MSRWTYGRGNRNEVEDFYQLNEDINMNTWKAIGSAVVSAVIIAVLGYLLSLGDLWTLNWHTLVTVAFGAFATSLIKFLGTTKNNNFAGIVPLPEK